MGLFFRLADEIIDVQRRQCDVLAGTGHVIGDGDDIVHTSVGADEVGVIDENVVDATPGRQLRFEFIDDVTSCMMSCLTLMPVICSKAFDRILASN